MKAVVLTFDRLPAHLLGCYGNEWIETPGFDRLAAGASVFDQHFAELPGPVGPDHSWWTGQFEFFSEPGAEKPDADKASQNWIRSLVEQGVNCRLVAEDSQGLPTELFNSSETVGGADGLNAEHDDVPIARLVQRGIELLAGDDGANASSATANLSTTADSPSELLWLHSRGVPSPWLPPRLFAELYLDELEEIVDGESGSEIASSIVDQFESDFDLVRLLLSDWQHESEEESDTVSTDVQQQSDSEDVRSPEIEFQISKLVFAGYVSMIDRWLLALLSAIENCDERILLIVTANQGRSFGEGADLMADPVTQSAGAFARASESEHSATGPKSRLTGALCDSELRTPLLIAEFSTDSSDHPFGSRHLALVQPVDVAATLEEWLVGDLAAGQDKVERAAAGRSLLAALSGGTPEGHSVTFHLGPDGELGVRNRNWALTTSSEALTDEESADSDVRLFAKPDDQWDVNDMASQYPAEVEALLNELRSRRSGR